MSAFPDLDVDVQSVQGVRRHGLSPAQYAALGTTLAVLGALTIWRSLLSLWTMWTTDALKSIGMVIPLVSLVLILRAWKSLGWRAEGTWWGLPIMVIAMVAAQIQQQAVLILVISPAWSSLFPPPASVLLAYGSGAVLLIGGVRLYRAALFPILLLWFANPVPHAFSLLVDLPLQEASAHIARAFAMSLGHSLTQDHLRLMFTPDFGMFIAPGCNGIRGSITMGFIALIAGYVYRFRWHATALAATGAILLGYLFNLVRLCLLVLYYVVALHYPSLQDKAENADYVMGAALFLVATFLLFTVIHHLRDAGTPEVKAVSARWKGFEGGAQTVAYGRIAAMGLIVLLGVVGVARAYVTTPRSFDASFTARFPQRLGIYSLVRTWQETLLTGTVVYDWGEYLPANGGTPISIGFSSVLSWDDPVFCHFVRGETPKWRGQLSMATGGPSPIHFSAAFYNDGVTQYLEATTLCRDAACDEFATGRAHLGFIYTRLDPNSLLGRSEQPTIRVLLRAETLGTTEPSDMARQQLTLGVRDFLASVKLHDIIWP